MLYSLFLLCEMPVQGPCWCLCWCLHCFSFHLLSAAAGPSQCLIYWRHILVPDRTSKETKWNRGLHEPWNSELKQLATIWKGWNNIYAILNYLTQFNFQMAILGAYERCIDFVQKFLIFKYIFQSSQQVAQCSREGNLKSTLTTWERELGNHTNKFR